MSYRLTSKGNPTISYMGWRAVAFQPDRPTAFPIVAESNAHPKAFKLWLQAPNGEQQTGRHIYATPEAAFRSARNFIDITAAERTANHMRAEATRRRREHIDDQLRAALEACGIPFAAPRITWATRVKQLIKTLHPDAGGDYTPERKERLLKALAAKEQLAKFTGYRPKDYPKRNVA